MLKKSIDTIFIDTVNIKDEDIEDISSIEQDIWARKSVLGEYIKCSDCGEVSSKETVFQGLPKEIRLMTVNKVEKLLGINRISCPCCSSSNTYHIYGDQNRQVIYETLKSPSSFLVIGKVNNEVVGFINGYVEKIDTIFSREFSYHFSSDIVPVLNRELGIEGNADVMTVSTLGAMEENSNIFFILDLLKKLFDTLPLSMDDLICVIEAIKGTFPYILYKAMGAKSLDNTMIENFRVSKDMLVSEILYQRSVISTYRENLDKSPINFVKKNIRLFSGKDFNKFT